MSDRQLTGTEIIQEGVKVLRACGFLCRVFNSHRRATTRDWIDVWAARHGVSWLIEVKGPGDALRPGQLGLAEQLAEHIGPALRYVLARGVADFQAIVEGRL